MENWQFAGGILVALILVAICYCIDKIQNKHHKHTNEED